MFITIPKMKDQLRRHLIQTGFVFDREPKEIQDDLRRHMGDQRYQQFLELNNPLHARGPHTGLAAQEDRVYDFMRDMKEASLMRSSSVGITLDASYFLYDKCLPSLSNKIRVIELACWNGGFASFIAKHHPQVSVVGVDRAQGVLECAKAHWKLPNLSFSRWDYYRDRKPVDLEPADVLLCSLGTNFDAGTGIYLDNDPFSVRRSPGYAREKEEGSAYFRNWRTAAKEGAVFYGVLRTVTFPRFLAFIDAALECGWTPLLNEFTQARVGSLPEFLPALAFLAKPSQPVSEDEALSHWMRFCAGGNHKFSEFAGGVALGFYRALFQKRVLAEREYISEKGFATKEELGIAGPLGYLYLQDSQPDYKLSLMTLAQAEQERTKLGQKPAPTPTLSGNTQMVGSGLSMLSLPAMPAGAIPVAARPGVAARGGAPRARAPWAAAGSLGASDDLF